MWGGGVSAYAKPPVPTLAEMVTACLKNADVAKSQQERWQQLAMREGPGPQLDAARRELARHTADYEHWSSYVAYYRGRVAKEGPNVVPTMTGVLGRDRGPGMAAVIAKRMNDPKDAAWTPPAQDRRLPREREDIGDDDIPF
jgi:hypothetical protein